MTINLNDYSKFIVTGTKTDGTRFRLTYINGLYAFGINLYRGIVWGVRKDTGRRQRLQRVWN